MSLFVAGNYMGEGDWSVHLRASGRRWRRALEGGGNAPRALGGPTSAPTNLSEHAHIPRVVGPSEQTTQGAQGRKGESRPHLRELLSTTPERCRRDGESPLCSF